MPALEMMWVDAFTTKPFAGNPCAVVFDADGLTAEQMQTIAFEMHLSETAFLMQSETADFRARYFTPGEEIPLAGHPTIASMFALVKTGRLTLGEQPRTVSLQLQAGTISVDVRPDTVSPLITMTQLKPQFLDEHDPEVVMPIFGLSADDALPGVPIQTVSTGTPQLMIAVKDHDALRRSLLDTAAYVAYRDQSGFFSPHLFCVEGITDRGQTFARHYGASPDTNEDPFTGSATGGMAAYLWHYGLLEHPHFIAEQGHWMNRPGMAHVEVVGPREDIEAVRVGGQAASVLIGQIQI
ncbi:MAG: phenazine biosynthesis protein PhzF [Anaerolineaceae bacterium]|nr:phenazine biosynthesis protein PhzF [Anaerolineaceae bacterium]